MPVTQGEIERLGLRLRTVGSAERREAVVLVAWQGQIGRLAESGRILWALLMPGEVVGAR
jgi:hypothetical protein